jgi:hypothetical protein
MPDVGEPSAFFGWRAGYCGTRWSCTGSAGFHITVFEPSYQEPVCWSGSEPCAPWAAGEKTRIFKVNTPIDPTAGGLWPVEPSCN